MRPLLVLLAAVLVTGCDSGGGSEQTSRQRPATEPAPAAEARPPAAITRAELDEHLTALQRIAREHGGNRSVGTTGYTASADYVAGRLRAAGWRVTLERIDVPAFRLRRASLAVGARRLRRGRDYQVLTYSGSGRATGRLRRLRHGCAAEEFTGLGESDVPVVGRGICFFRTKAANAEHAGARALIVVDDPPTGRGVPSGTLGTQKIGIPVVLVSDAAFRSAGDGGSVRIAVRTSARPRRSLNVIAETPRGEGDRVVMAGGHLDSVADGPGINDNGSGVATLIEAAEAIGAKPGGARVRLGFWGAEEVGLVGSRHYVDSLSRAERRRIGAYLNFDMVGSPNAVAEIYMDGDPKLGRVLRRAAGGRSFGRIAAGGASDHAPFLEAGIPVNGLYTGGPERGPGGRPRDPCYHLACDTVRNVDRGVLLRMARIAARALERLSARHRSGAGGS